MPVFYWYDADGDNRSANIYVIQFTLLFFQHPSRFRQWMRASEMLERHDPSIIATIKGERDAFRKIVVFRESALNAMKKKYGDDLIILFGGDE